MLIGRAFAVNLVAATILATMLASCGGGGAPKRVFVSGYVSAAVTTPATKLHDIALPHASVFLYLSSAPANPVASTLSDLSGRFKLKADKPGVYDLCVELKGFPRTCQRHLTLAKTSTTISPFRMARTHGDTRDRATLFGKTTLADGSIPRGFAPMLKVNAFVKYQVKSAAGIEFEGYLNEFGEYIAPSVPTSEDFTIELAIDNAKRTILVRKETQLAPNADHEFNIYLKDHPPKINLVSAAIAGKPVETVALNGVVTLTATANDLDGDQLAYRWLLPDGATDGVLAGPNASNKVQWTVPGKKGAYSAVVVVSDGRGGYATSSATVNVGDTRVTFSGVVVDVAGNPIDQAQVDINGRLLNTNADGRFTLKVPVDDRYVMNLRKPGVDSPGATGYGTGSYVYARAINGGRWVMRPAQVFTVDPTQPIKIQQARNERDCLTPVPWRIDWGAHPGTGIFQWQDGRGYPTSIPERAQRDERAVFNVATMLSRLDPSLPGLFYQAGYGPKGADNPQRETPRPRKLPCLDGPAIDIPANSLVDVDTHQPPPGDVQIALSAVSLSTPQMPGDFSASDGSGTISAMESFGAGSIEIGDGGHRYNLKQGASAEVSIPVDATQVAGGAALAPTIPFLYYNETNATWEQDGAASLVNTAAGPLYRRKVAHFSNMNADILKTGNSCVAVEVDPAAGFTLPLHVEVTLQPSVVNPNVIQVRDLVVETLKSTAIYNLPNNSDIVLTPIVQGTKADGSTGSVPAGVFVVNTGGPQSGGSGAPTINADGTYYSEDAGGNPTGPCASRVTLTNLALPTPSSGEFLQGLSFQSSNIDEFNATIGGAILQGAADYYLQADPRGKRANFTLFKSENKFGEPLNVPNGEVEWDAQFANSGDLGFGRDMHCRRNRADDGQFDVACYVTNYGQPPKDFADQVDADNALAGTDPDATVAMEFSRVENPASAAVEFPDNDRAVKFYVYGGDPNAAPLQSADLDGVGARPVPQLCMVCHGGDLASLAADPANPLGPKKGAFTDRADIVGMKSNFLPFDLTLYNFPAAKDKNAQEAAFKGLNIDIVQEVASHNGADGAAVNELVNAFYNNGALAQQATKPVVANWDPGNPNSDAHRFYANVFGPTCRTCHITGPFGAPNFTSQAEFESKIDKVQNRVCGQKIMPHSKRTSAVFWSSLDPNMPAFLELYGQTLPNWSPAPGQQCGEVYQAGGVVALSTFTDQIFPILTNNCLACHGSTGNANFSVGGTPQQVYNSIINATAKDGVSKYIVANNPGASLILNRIKGIGGARMPLGGPDLTATDTDSPPDGVNDSVEIENWINAGAPGP